MADVSKAHKLKLANSRKRFKELQELKKKKDASQKLENADIIDQPTPVDSLTSSTHSSINNEASVENITGDTVITPASLPNYFDNTNYGDNSMFFDNLSTGEVSELNKHTSTSNIFNYFNTPHPQSSFESMVSNIVDTPKHTEDSFESKFNESYALFPQESQHNYVAETQQILHPDQDGLSLEDPEIKENELFEHHRNSELFSSKNRQDLINYLQNGSKEKISESENSAIKNEIVCSSNTAQAEVKHSSAESLKQLSSQMAQLIEPEYAVSNPITDLEKRNLELAALLEQAQLNSEQQKGQLEELQARIANLETETLQKVENNNIRTAREISRLKEELQSHIQTVGLLVAEKTELSASLSQLELISKQKNSECEELQARLKASRSRAFELEQELNILRAERTKKDSTGQEQSGIIEQLRQYSSSLQEQREELAQDLLEVREKLKNSSEDNFQLQKQNQELSRKLSLAEIRIQQITSGEQHQVEGQIQKLTQEKFELEKQLSNLALNMKTTTKEREESTSQFQQYTQELNSQLAGLSNQVQRLQQENEDLSIQEQNRVKHIGDLERQLQSLQNEQVTFAVNRPSGELNLKNELDSTRELCIQLQLIVGPYMTQKNTFKSVPLYDSGNCLYQRRTQKCSNSPMINSPRNINRLSSEKYFGANCAKDRIREMPVELCSSEDTLVTNRTGSCFNPDRSEELSIINRHYQSMPSSANSGSSCPKSNYSTGEVSAKKHIENYHRSSGVTFRENDQQYSSESDANVSNKYYPDRSNMLSERKKMQYHRTENENNQKELMESGKIWNRRVFERKLGESYEKKFNEEKIEHHSVGQIHGFQMSSGLDSDIKFGRNPSPPLSEDYEENYLDTQMANRREETLTRPDHYEERQNLIEVHEDDIDQSVYVENPDNQEFEYGSQDTKNTNKNEGMDYACAGNWERVYKKPQTDKFANIYPSVVHQKMLCPKSVIEEPYPVSKSSKPLPYSLSKQIKPLSNPQQSSFFPESTNSQIYYSPGPTNPQSTSALPYQKSLQVSGGLQSTQFNITSDISEREMETSRENFKIYQQNFARSDTHQGELVSPPNKSLQKSVMMKKSSKPSRRDGIKAFESACGGIVTIVVLKGFPKKKMMPSELNKLETAILNEMDKIPEGAFHPRFVEYNKKRGSLIIVSENRYAANWLENVVGILEPWEGARFKTIEREQEPILWLSIFSSDPKVLLNCQQLDRVQNAIMDKIDIVDGGFQPELLDCYQKHQSLVVACNNRKTADWLKKTVQTLEPWENAQLACIDPTELGGYKKFKMDIVPWDDPNKILDRIESQNDNLCTGSWKIIHSKVGRNRHVGVLVVAVKKSLLDVLRGVDFRPFLNLRRVFMQEVGDYNLF